MATVNLGSIKFKWKGTYAGGTAYTIDDVVSYNGSSYICILASTGNLPTNATYFEQMSSAGTNGTNGTDLTTTLTTQGDLVYRDGSGLQRLGAGTAGQVLQTGGAGANPSWGDVAGGLISTGFYDNTTSHTITATSFTEINGSAFNVTMTSGQKIHLFGKVHGYQNTDDKTDRFSMFVTESGGAQLNILNTANGSGGMGSSRASYNRYWNANAFDHGLGTLSGWFTWTAQTTGTHSFTIKIYADGAPDLRITEGTTVWYMITSV